MSSIHVPDLKTQKYDRQLRLWAATGQTALENAKVCLLHATSTGCEIIKNLVLPGVGSVTIVDNSVVSQTDIQTNFFLEPDNVGRSKAESTAALLQELNDDVATSFVQKSVADIIHQNPDFFAPFDMIIAINVPEKEMLALSNICEKNNKILIYVQSKGLYGIFRIQAPEHTIIETHPENAVDLRLGCPFKQLIAHVDKYNLDALDQTDHGHVPFVVVILKYLNIWKETHGGQMPQNYSERNEFKNLIKSGMRTADEENFEEAIANVWRLSSTDIVTSNIREIFQDPACENITDKTSSFWIIAKAVKDFVANEGEGQLPLPGKLPDMKSDTNNYVQLQNVYREKSLQDFESVKQRVHKLLETVNLPVDSIPESMIEGFCKNAAHIKVIRYRSLFEEYTKPRSEKLSSLLKQDENIAVYVTFRAAEKFALEHQRYPGSLGGDNVCDVSILQQLITPTLMEMGVPETEAKQLASEKTMEKIVTNYVRFADQETANIAALMGGLVAQEAIKLITKQYIPINNTCIFNGIASTSNVYEL